MSENATPPPKQSKDVESSLREQIVQVRYSKFDTYDSLDDTEKEAIDNMVALVTTYIEAAEIKARHDELSMMTNATGLHAVTFPHLEKRLKALQAQKAVLESPTERSK